jgi:hypothetical protein
MKHETLGGEEKHAYVMNLAAQTFFQVVLDSWLRMGLQAGLDHHCAAHVCLDRGEPDRQRGRRVEVADRWLGQEARRHLEGLGWLDRVLAQVRRRCPRQFVAPLGGEGRGLIRFLCRAVSGASARSVAYVMGSPQDFSCAKAMVVSCASERSVA